MRTTVIALCAVVVGVWGCGTTRVTDPPRTAVEQLLIAAAAEQAAAQLDFEFLAGRKVFLDDSMVDRVDKPFVVATVRAAALRAGVMFADKRDAAQYVIELRAGAVGVNRNDSLLGLPGTQVPTGSAVIATPEVAAYKHTSQVGACSLAFVAYAREDGRFFYASGPVYGFSDHRARWLLGIGPTVRDNIAPARTVANTAATPAAPPAPAKVAPNIP